MVKPISQLGPDMRRRLEKIERDVIKSERQTETAAALAAKQAQETVMRQDAGGDLRLSRVRSGRGAKIGARFDRVAGSVNVRATGPVPLIANRTKPHVIPKAGKPKLLSIPGVGVRRSVQHPGTQGKDTWNEGRRLAIPAIRTVIGKRTDAVVVRSFKTGG